MWNFFLLIIILYTYVLLNNIFVENKNVLQNSPSTQAFKPLIKVFEPESDNQLTFLSNLLNELNELNVQY